MWDSKRQVSRIARRICRGPCQNLCQGSPSKRPLVAWILMIIRAISIARYGGAVFFLGGGEGARSSWGFQISRQGSTARRGRMHLRPSRPQPLSARARGIPLNFNGHSVIEQTPRRAGAPRRQPRSRDAVSRGRVRRGSVAPVAACPPRREGGGASRAQLGHCARGCRLRIGLRWVQR